MKFAQMYFGSLTMALGSILGLYPVSLALLFLTMFAMCYAGPPSLQLSQVLVLLPAVLALLLLAWGTYWSPGKAGIDDVWQGVVLAFGFWATVLISCVLLFHFRTCWIFFGAILADELFFVWICALVAGMCISDQWL